MMFKKALAAVLVVAMFSGCGPTDDYTELLKSINRERNCDDLQFIRDQADNVFWYEAEQPDLGSKARRTEALQIQERVRQRMDKLDCQDFQGGR